MVKELTTPKYYFQDGKFRLEEKDQLKKRLGFSPNKADALCLTFALPEMPSSKTPEAQFTPSKHLADYDPFAAERL
jgi:hypothetical protein